MPQPQVTLTQWNALKKETRVKLAILFALPKTGVVEMQYINGFHEMKCDGHSNADLALMTVDRLQEATGSTETDPGKLIHLMAEQVESLPEPEPAEAEVVPEAPPEATQEAPVPTEPASKWAAKTCCGSKGARHLKTCETLKAKA